MRKTGLTYHELYLWHDTGNAAGTFISGLQVQPGDHFEHPETKRRLRNLLEVSGLLEKLVQIHPKEATFEQLQLFHTKEYIEKIRKKTLRNVLVPRVFFIFQFFSTIIMP